MQGPVRGMPGSQWEGATNADVLGEITEALGGPPERGKLYRLTVALSSGHPASCIAEYCGLGLEAPGHAPHDLTDGEPVLLFAIRNPVLPANAKNGTTDNPWHVWPLDITHISPAQPGDLDRPMSYRMEGEELTGATAPGRPPIQ